MARIKYQLNNRRKTVRLTTGQIEEFILRIESYGARIISVIYEEGLDDD